MPKKVKILAIFTTVVYRNKVAKSSNARARKFLWVPGIYVTDLTIEPINEYNRTEIATILRMPRFGPPDPTLVTAYVEISIDRNRVGLLYLPIFPHQYLYPHRVMWNDGVRIKFLRIGSFITAP